MICKDRKKVRIQLSSVTSYFMDNEIVSTMNASGNYPAIQLTIGSANLRLIYDSKEERDSDVNTLDLYFYPAQCG